MKEACRSLKLVRFFIFFSAEFFLLADNCFSSHRFHRSPQIFFIGRFFIGLSSWEIFHRISRMNRKAFLLIGLLTDFRGYLASGQWLAPDICSCCFFVTQISQMTQIFLRGRVLSHRFHRYTQIFYGISGESLYPISGGICNDRTGRIRENP